MNYKLEREHLLGLTCSELEKLGREHVAHARVLLEEEAARLDPKRSWRELITEGMSRSPEPNWLRESYVAEMERARQFVLDRRIAPVLPNARLEVVDTPVFDRAMTPFASYQPPAPFDADQTGFFHVTPIDLRRSKDEQARQLAGHCSPMLPIIALHEGYPGHHLQLCHANQAPTRLRRITDSEVFSEGWALYCEDLMWEQGFFTSDPLTRLFQLRTALWRAHRVVIDAGLHGGRMTWEEAVALLVDDVMLDPQTAASEVDRYVMNPTEPLSYLLGKLAITDLRNEARRRLGAGFDLYAFHEALLASGTIPPALVREELWDRLKVS